MRGVTTVVVVVVVGTGAGIATGGGVATDVEMLGGAAAGTAIPGTSGPRFWAFTEATVESSKPSAAISGATNLTIPAPPLNVSLLLMRDPQAPRQ